ncbi:MAG: hypothetical protein M1830_003389 [Pleopsidium flavum]|nr:MAG: hypothetical protein M1830_003389 [Pleopsidium flavum]
MASSVVFELATETAQYLRASLPETLRNPAIGIICGSGLGGLADAHLNLAGLVGIHPLRGPNADDFGVRFPALSDAYDLELRSIAHQVWKNMAREQANRQLHEGVYAFGLGADLVGMSTVPEIIVARHCEIRVLALSLVTNNAVLNAGPRGDDIRTEGVKGEQLNKVIEHGKANHEEVIEAGHRAAKDMQVKRSPQTRYGDHWKLIFVKQRR